MTAKSSDPRRINLNLRVSSQTKKDLENMALEDYRSLTNTIEKLIADEISRRAEHKKKSGSR
jgi:hypothetical protein